VELGKNEYPCRAIYLPCTPGLVLKLLKSSRGEIEFLLKKVLGNKCVAKATCFGDSASRDSLIILLRTSSQNRPRTKYQGEKFESGFRALTYT
jgi:hypothetical protein